MLSRRRQNATPSSILALALVEPLSIQNLLLWDYSPRQGLQLHNWWQFGTTIVWSRGVIASVSSGDGVCKSVPLTVETIEHLESWDQLQSCSKWAGEEGGSIFRRLAIDSQALEPKHWNVVASTSKCDGLQYFGPSSVLLDVPWGFLDIFWKLRSRATTLLLVPNNDSAFAKELAAFNLDEKDARSAPINQSWSHSFSSPSL